MTGDEEQVIFDTISLFINKGLMFTAFDVTKAVRKHGLHILHKDVRKLVHSYGFPSDYDNMKVDVVRLLTGSSNNSVPKPILYFPKGSDVNDYIPVDLGDDKGSSSTSDIVLTDEPVFTVDSLINLSKDFDKKHAIRESGLAAAWDYCHPFDTTTTTLPDNVFPVNLDNRGRYCVRAKVVSKASFNKGESVFLMCDNGEITISAFASIVVDTIMTVDRYSNLLIFSSYLKKTFGSVPNNLDITIGNRKITIRKYN